MYKHLLIATDGSELALKAVETGLSLAKELKAKATVVTVTESWTTVVSGEMGAAFPIEEYEQGCAASAKQVLDDVSARAKKAGVDVKVIHVKDQFPAEGIIEAAEKNGCDLIVMASHGRRGLTRMLLGSQASNVLTHSKIPVLICR